MSDKGLPETYIFERYHKGRLMAQGGRVDAVNLDDALRKVKLLFPEQEYCDNEFRLLKSEGLPEINNRLLTQEEENQIDNVTRWDLCHKAKLVAQDAKTARIKDEEIAKLKYQMIEIKNDLRHANNEKQSKAQQIESERAEYQKSIDEIFATLETFKNKMDKEYVGFNVYSTPYINLKAKFKKEPVPTKPEEPKK